MVELAYWWLLSDGRRQLSSNGGGRGARNGTGFVETTRGGSIICTVSNIVETKRGGLHLYLDLQTVLPTVNPRARRVK